jgi:hypothetical protein
MNLMEAIFMYLGTKVSIKQYVVMELVHHTHAMFAEILLSRLALAYINQGGGFSHCAAGMSHAGAFKVDADYWRIAQEKLVNSHAFRKRVEDEIETNMVLEDTYIDIRVSAEIQDSLLESFAILDLVKKGMEEKARDLANEMAEFAKEQDAMMELSR